MVNRVVLVGRMVKDPELRTATSGNSVCSFTVAANSRLKGSDGKFSTCFMPCVCFGKTANSVAQSTRKGSLVGVDGFLNQRKYQRKDGTIASAFEVICDSVQFLEPKDAAKGFEEVPPFDDAPVPNGNNVGGTESVEDEDSKNLETYDLPDDDLPF